MVRHLTIPIRPKVAPVASVARRFIGLKRWPKPTTCNRSWNDNDNDDDPAEPRISIEGPNIRWRAHQHR